MNSVRYLTLYSMAWFAGQFCATTSSQSFVQIDVYNGSHSLVHSAKPMNSSLHNVTNLNPTTVYLSIYVRSISSINPESMDYVADLYLQQQWYDSRLANGGSNQTVTLNDRKMIQKMWKPDIVFINSKDSNFHYVTIPNMLMRIEPNGSVLYILRLKIKFDCMMDFYKYPIDTQKCPIELSTFAKTRNELQLLWGSIQPVTLYKQLKLTQFKITSVHTYHCNISYYFGNFLNIGQYSCLKVEFNLARQVSYHLVQSYLCTTMIVVISWLSFWLDVNSMPARTTLGVTTLLTISSKGVGIETNLPPVTYLKAIDVWIFVCTTFVFAALIEFTVANYIWREQNKHRFSQQSKWTRQQSQRRSQTNLSPQPSWRTLTHKLVPCCVPLDQSYSTTLHLALSDQRRDSTRAERIDQLSRVMFPLLFGLFAFLYWFYYCHWA